MGNCCEKGLIRDKDYFTIKIKPLILNPEDNKKYNISECPNIIKNEVKHYFNSNLFKALVSLDVNRVVKETPRYMIINIINVIVDVDTLECIIYGIIEIKNRRYEYMPTLYEFREMIINEIISGCESHGYPNNMFKKYLGITEKDYKIIIEEKRVNLNWI